LFPYTPLFRSHPPGPGPPRGAPLLRGVHRLPRDAPSALPLSGGSSTSHPPSPGLPRPGAAVPALRGLGALGEGEPPPPAPRLSGAPPGLWALARLKAAVEGAGHPLSRCRSPGPCLVKQHPNPTLPPVYERLEGEGCPTFVTGRPLRRSSTRRPDVCRKASRNLTLTVWGSRGSLPGTCAAQRSSAPWGPPPKIRRCSSVSSWQGWMSPD